MVRGYEVTIIYPHLNQKNGVSEFFFWTLRFFERFIDNYRNFVTSYHNISINMIDLTLNSKNPEVTIIIYYRNLP